MACSSNNKQKRKKRDRIRREKVSDKSGEEEVVKRGTEVSVKKKEE